MTHKLGNILKLVLEMQCSKFEENVSLSVTRIQTQAREEENCKKSALDNCNDRVKQESCVSPGAVWLLLRKQMCMSSGRLTNDRVLSATPSA